MSIESTGPIWFYFVYMHCATILKITFNYSAEQIISHNFIVVVARFITAILYAYLSYKISPLKILKMKLVICASIIIFIPYILTNISSPFYLLLLQFSIFLFQAGSFPAAPIFYKQFPVFKRFRCVSISFAVIKAIMYVVVSFGLVYLIDYFDNWGIVILFVPFLVAYGFALRHFEMLERLRNA